MKTTMSYANWEVAAVMMTGSNEEQTLLVAWTALNRSQIREKMKLIEELPNLSSVIGFSSLSNCSLNAMKQVANQKK